MKTIRRIVLLLFIAMIFSALPAWASGAFAPQKDVELQFTIGSSTYLVDGVEKQMDAAPVIIEGRTLLPIRYVAVRLGAGIEWHGAQKKVVIASGGHFIVLYIGQSEAEIDRRKVPIDADNPNVAPMIIDGRTMVPVRFVAENLGCSVEWDAASQRVRIVSKVPNPDQELLAESVLTPSNLATIGDVATLEARYGQQLDDNLGRQSAVMDAKDRQDCLKLLALLDRQIEQRAAAHDPVVSQFEYRIRLEFNALLDALTERDYFVPQQVLAGSQPGFVGNQQHILSQLKQMMSKTDYSAFFRDYFKYLEAPDWEQHDALLAQLDNYSGFDSKLVMLLLDRYRYHQTKAFYEIDDQFNLTPGHIIGDDAAVISGGADTAAVASLWDLMKKIIPTEDLQYFDYLSVGSDGVNREFASVSLSPKDDGSGKRWLFQVDDADLDIDLVSMVIHEYMHYLTLNETQVDYVTEFYANRYCDQFFVSKENGLLNQFYLRFWRNYVLLDQNVTSAHFYMRSPDSFVSRYAAINIKEDIADSLRAFVLRDKPSGNSVADQKIQFFYDYPELVRLRQQIRQALGAEQIDDATFAVEGSIDQPVVLEDSADVKITFNKAYYRSSEAGLIAALSIENKSDQALEVGLFSAKINGVNFRPWYDVLKVAGGATKQVDYFLLSDNNLKLAGIDKLSEMTVGIYYTRDGVNVHTVPYVDLVNPQQRNYQQVVNFTGKQLVIDYKIGKLTMTVGIDKVIRNAAGQLELYILSENEGKIPIEVSYDTVLHVNIGKPTARHGAVLESSSAFMEALPFQHCDMSQYQGVTISNLVISDLLGNEIFKIDKLFIEKDDFQTVFY